jgi:hypothetical protein
VHRQHTNDDGCASLSTNDDRIARQHIRVGRGAKPIRQPFKAGLRLHIGDEQPPVPDVNAVVKDAVHGAIGIEHKPESIDGDGGPAHGIQSIRGAGQYLAADRR